MGIVISIANHKGGVGKTTTAINLSAGLALSGYKVLVIDSDPQANATFSLGLGKQEKTLYQTLVFQDNISKAIVQSKSVEIVPSSVHLAAFEKNNDVGKEFILQEQLQEIKDLYDFILIDCPPSLGALTVSALTASDYALIVLQPEPLAIQGMTEFVKILRTVKTRMNPDLDILGVLATSYNSRTVLHRELIEFLEKEYGEMIFNTKIRANINLPEAQSMGKDIFDYSPNSAGAEDYEALTKEIISRLTEA
ncbi:MAG: ParA family protein [Bacteroidia bacterium]|nr:ParA family protein [Bacteroidia bacterium]